MTYARLVRDIRSRARCCGIASGGDGGCHAIVCSVHGHVGYFHPSAPNRHCKTHRRWIHDHRASEETGRTSDALTKAIRVNDSGFLPSFEIPSVLQVCCNGQRPSEYNTISR